MSTVTPFETAGTLVVRLKPNEDLVTGVEAACREAGVARALVRSGVGSLVDAALSYGEGKRVDVTGPGIEILTLIGEIRDGEAHLTGTIADQEANIFGGRFVPDANPICITLELVLEVVA
ncbi:MAG: DNA-binding protein [Alphaproteobacteria bacterium]|nr:DNA-binding protein [Alphaproteobacteria bacterium]